MGIIKNDSAQFMLLAGFIISIGLVITTVMLNNIIFESNMAGEEGGGPLKYDVVNLMQISRDEMKSAYRSATAPGQNAALKIVNFSKQIQNFNANLSYIYAMHGQGVNLSSDLKNWNENIYANFSENGTANGATSWIVIENVNSSNITVNVTTLSLPFNISITNSTKSWQINFTIAPENRTINDNQIKANVTGPYAISFINGANVSGLFNITGTTKDTKTFIRARDYIINSTILFSNSNMRTNITFPVSVPW